jgi:hypothetical protein
MDTRAVSRRAVAFHEAAHAVACLRLGLIVTRAVIQPPETWGQGEQYGHCVPLYRPIARSQEELERMPHERRLRLAKLREARYRAIVSMAGEMAGSYHGLDDRDHTDEVVALARELFPSRSKQQAFVFRVTTRAAEIVNDHWPCIETIAEQLLEHGELRGRTLKAIYRHYPAEPQLPLDLFAG